MSGFSGSLHHHPSPRAFDTFIELTDTPNSYTGSGLEVLRVNAGETALEFIDLDSIYLRQDNNLSDLDDAGTARTNLGLVAGGAGDIWVEKTGDTMSGNLSFTAGTQTIAGIENQNLLDKTVAETVSALYTFTSNLTLASDDATLFLEDTSPTVISGSADSKYWSIKQTSLILGSLLSQLSIAPETLDRKSHSLSIDSQIILFPNIPDGAEDCNLIRFNSTYDNDGGEVYLLRDSSTVNMDDNNSVVGTLLVDGQINQSVNAVNGYTMFNSTLIINYDTNGAATGITTNINDQTTLQANGIAMSDVVSTNYRTIYSRPKFRSTSSGTARFNDIYGLEVAHIFRYESGTTLNIKGDWFGLKVNQITEEVSTGTLTFPGKTYGAFIGSQTVGTENYGIWIDDAEDGALVLDADGLSGRILLGENQEASIDYSSASNLVLHAQRSGSGHIVLHSPKTSTGDPTGVEGKIYWNTVDNVIKMYADGAWRTLASW